MPASMTGFGSARGPLGDGEVVIALKSVNNRFLKLTIKAADALAAYERDIESAIRGAIKRGTVTCQLRLEGPVLYASFRVSTEQALAYRDALSELARALGDDDAKAATNLELIAALPGVIETQGAGLLERDEAIGAQLGAVLDEATQALIQTRAGEGDQLAADLRGRVGTIRDNTGKLAELSPRVVTETHQKLTDRLNRLLAQDASAAHAAVAAITPQDLAREAALIADRGDIAEEVTRLTHHCDEFDATLARAGEIGRRLDFTCQEMLREANTIASKCADGEMATLVVDVKVEIERIKEQVQNIE